MLRGQIAKAAHRPFLVEEPYVFPHLGWYVLTALDAEIDEELGLDPAVDRFHRAVLGRRPWVRHRPCDIIWEKELVEGLRRVHGPVVGVEYRLHVRVLFLQLEEAAQAFEIAFPVAFFCAEGRSL